MVYYRAVKFKICAFVSAALLAGCGIFREAGDADEVFSATEEFVVTPANGVWDEEFGRTGDPANLSFTFRLERRASGIDVIATVTDDSISTDDSAPGDLSAPAWNDDSLQVHFDGDLSRASDSHTPRELLHGGEYALVANGAAQSDYSSKPKSFGKDWTGEAVKERAQGGGWTIRYTLRFSWACLGYAKAPDVHEDVTFGFNICAHDDDDGGRGERALYWKGNPSLPYRDESRFGTITLKGKAK